MAENYDRACTHPGSVPQESSRLFLSPLSRRGLSLTAQHGARSQTQVQKCLLTKLRLAN